jgi:epsilon-lactone hydrolase
MLKLTVKERVMGGVPVVEVTPEGWHEDGRRLLYPMSARSTLFSSGLMARATGMRVISIDYTLAPQAKWRRLMEQVTGVYKTLLKSGITPNGVGIYGDSAGGSIAAGMVLKLRDEGIAMPGALLLWSPWSDVSMIGDTYQTLADWDPLLTVDGLIASAAAYAIPAEQKTPMSPLSTVITRRDFRLR